MAIPRVASTLVAAIVVCAGISVVERTLAAQQQAAAPYTPKQSDRPSALDGDEPGFQPIFDGKTLAGWEGDPTYWRAENGSLVGEITARDRASRATRS